MVEQKKRKNEDSDLFVKEKKQKNNEPSSDHVGNLFNSSSSLLRPFIYESDQFRFFVFKYPSPCTKLEYSHVSSKSFFIKVTIQDAIPIENILETFPSIITKGLKENTKPEETLLHSEAIPNDVSVESIKYGMYRMKGDHLDDRVYIIIFEKSQRDRKSVV